MGSDKFNLGHVLTAVGVGVAIITLIVSVTVPEVRRTFHLSETLREDDSRSSHISQVQSLYALKRYDEALDLIDKNASKNGPDFLVLKGNILWDQEKQDESIQCHIKAERTDPDYLPALENLAAAYALRKEWPKELIYRQKVVKKSGSEKAYLALAMCEFKSDMYLVALNHFKLCINEFDARGTISNRCGQCCYRVGDFIGAKRWYENAVKRNESYSIYRSNLGFTFLKMDRLEKASEQFNLALGLLKPEERGKALNEFQRAVNATRDRIIYGR